MMRRIATAAVWALAVAAAEAKIPVTEDMRLKDKEGTTYAVVIDCPQAFSGKKKSKFFGGSKESQIGGDRCGECLIESNWGTYIRYPYDLYIKGTIVDEKGEPVKNQLVHFFFPNGWTVKTRTAETGFFRIVMGATAERKSNTKLEMDLGTKRVRSDKKPAYYSLFVMPESFNSCESENKKR